MAGTYPKAKYRGTQPLELGDLRDPSLTSSTDRWPYISVVVNSATEEANLDPTYTWVDDPQQITGQDGSVLSQEPPYP